MFVRVPLLVAALVLATAGAAVADAPAPLTARFVQTSTWNSGYGADYVITNPGDSAVTGWTVEFDLPSGTTVTSSWSTVRTSSGNHYRFSNTS